LKTGFPLIDKNNHLNLRRFLWNGAFYSRPRAALLLWGLLGLALISCDTVSFQHQMWHLKLNRFSGRFSVVHSLWGNVIHRTVISDSAASSPFKDWKVTPTLQGWKLTAGESAAPVWRIEISGDTLSIVSDTQACVLSAEGRLGASQLPVHVSRASVVLSRLGVAGAGEWDGLHNRETGWTLTGGEAAALRVSAPGRFAWRGRIQTGECMQWVLHAPRSQLSRRSSGWRLDAPPGQWREMVRELTALGRYAAPWGLEAALVDLGSDSLRLAAAAVLSTDKTWDVVTRAVHKIGLKPVFLLQKESYLEQGDQLQSQLQKWDAGLRLETPTIALDTCVAEAQLQAVLTWHALTGRPLSVETPFGRTPYGRVVMMRRSWPLFPVALQSWPGLPRSETDAVILTETGVSGRCVLGLFDTVNLDKVGSEIPMLSQADAFWMLDLWNETLTSAAGALPPVAVPTGGCRLFLLQSVRPHPQYLCSDRHLTAPLKREAAAWRGRYRSLKGESRAWPGETRKLFIAVPPGWQVDQVKVNGVVAYEKHTGALMILAVEAPAGKNQQILKWSVTFNEGEQPSLF